MKKQILGVKIDDINIDQAVKIVENWLKKSGKHYIVTTNPEFIMTAQKDAEFRKILNNADLSIPDGRGLQLSGDIVCNIPGVDFMERLCQMARDCGAAVGFFGGSPGIAEECAECLQRKYPGLKVNFPRADLLFVALGHPRQEKWIYENLPKMPVKVAMGVGGAFDYFSGRVPRAPLWMRNLGFEWLFRLITQPWRVKRQLSLIKYLLMIW